MSEIARLMTMRRRESELLAFRALAEELASSRKERVTTGHLLAALASRAGAAADLLIERSLDAERLLRAARTSVDDEQDALRRAIERAREVSTRMGASEPVGVHLLIALLGDRKCAGYRVLDQCGVDVSRLRVVAMNLGLGLVGRRRIVTRRDTNLELVRHRTTHRARGVTVPLVPSPRAVEPKAAVESTPIPTEPVAAPSSKSPSVAPPEPKSAPVPAAAPRRMPRADRTRRRHATSSRFVLDAQAFPTLCSLGKNLTAAAEAGELDPVVGRDEEVEQTLDVLAKRHGNNPCLVGTAGVGKTSVVRALARRIALDGDIGALDSRIIVEIPVSELVAGTGVRGALAQRIGALRKEVAAAQGRVVLFFDEIHQLFSGDGADEMTGELKLAFARGELPCIGATTREDYKKAIDADAALARRFSTVEVLELCSEDAFLVLDSLAPAFERHHRVSYEETALAAAVAWSVRYLPDRALPEKAVSIIDLAGARTRRRGGDGVTPEIVAEVVADMADMPVERLLESDGDRMLRLESLLAERVVGHEEALRRIARILRRNAAGLGSRRPIGTFLLLGPSGVGKTETAKAIAEALFSSDTAMTRLDLSEFGEAHATSRLIGSPPGYVGHEAGGQLTEAVRRRPYQVILLDEIEKAHPEVLETFLQVFDEGRLTDGRGRTVDFTNTVILLTSNLGAAEASSATRRRVGFSQTDEIDAEKLESVVTAAARAALAPELYNRIDEVIVFRPLTRDYVREITRRLLVALGRRLAEDRGVELEVHESAIEYLLDAGGFDPLLGARPMKRTIARYVEAPLAERILRGELKTGATLRLRALDGVLRCDELAPTSRSAAE